MLCIVADASASLGPFQQDFAAELIARFPVGGAQIGQGPRQRLESRRRFDALLHQLRLIVVNLQNRRDDKDVKDQAAQHGNRQRQGAAGRSGGKRPHDGSVAARPMEMVNFS